MTEKHKWYDVIVAWANGEKIQFNFDNYGWEDFNLSSPGFDNEKTLWRIKPRTKIRKFRMALVKRYGGMVMKEPYAVAVEIPLDTFTKNDLALSGFIKWIGDTVEVEIEE